jgi:hypothetical protein
MNTDLTVVRRHAIAEFQSDNNRTSFVHPTTGLAYAVNDTGRSILRSLQPAESVKSIANRIAAEFDVTEDEARPAVASFLGQMAELGVVEVENTNDPLASIRARYLELLRRALVNMIYPEHELRIDRLESGIASADLRTRDRELRDIRYRNADDFAGLIAAKLNGDVWRGRPGRYSHTMVGMRRLEHLQWCAERVFEDAIPGDFLEAGVCQGGASIFMRALQAVHDPARFMWLADSFEGLPVPDNANDEGYDFSEAKQPWLAMTRAAVEDNFRTYDLLSDQVRFLSGWFRDTLPTAPVGPLAILRIDADLYTSTREVLTALYDKVPAGGFVIVDDYNAFIPCRSAVDEFREERKIAEPLRRIDRMAVYWRRAI